MIAGSAWIASAVGSSRASSEGRDEVAVAGDLR
jgi:hypothetical protein